MLRRPPPVTCFYVADDWFLEWMAISLLPGQSERERQHTRERIGLFLLMRDIPKQEREHE